MTDEKKIARARQVFDAEIAGLERTRDSLGASFVATVDLLNETLDAGGLVVMTGVGKSLQVAEKTSAIFASTGTRSIVLNPVQAMHGDLGMVSSRDVLLALSFSGESDELLRLVPAIRRHGLKIVALTGRSDSSLARLSDIVLEIPCGPEACPFGMAPTTSATATMAMGDALAMTMLEARRFNKESYALNHPAGAIGRALVLRVSDVMRTGERVAVVSPETPVLDTLLAMTKAQGGSAVVADAEGRLVGIFTDGDFRRAFAAGSVDGQSALGLSDPVSKHMTRNPLFVNADAYAAELLRIFEKRRIDDLPVCDVDGKVLGLVDIQDLPKLKVL
ncbi:MAG: KpsF/GutQ family sugar-phosphate isomerase [Kiritimatiellae bacterium]|nr:KpsF/GutQ family sugar-phosphate isomerase [Kiritimatiellia bacterium]